MLSVVFLIAASAAISLALTPLVRGLFSRLGVVDAPDGRRKLHSRAVPRVGGICVWLAYIGALLLLSASPFGAGEPVSPHLAIGWHLVPAVALIFLVGLVDDLVGLRPRHKLALQTLAALLAYTGGIRAMTIAGQPVGSWWGMILVVGWLLFCTNAFNLIDGMDGLAAGLGLFATVSLMVSGLLSGNMGLVLATAPLAGALLGFLRYNFNPASIFLGDSGSLLIGFLLGCLGLVSAQKTVTLLGLAGPLMALSIPLLDTSIAIARRFLRVQPIFSPDRDHIHHRLLDRGLGPRSAAFLLYGAALLAAGFSVVQTLLATSYSAIVFVLFCVLIVIAIQSLDYAEFGVLRRGIAGKVRRIVRAEMSLRSLKRSLDAADTPEEFWDHVCSVIGAFGFSSVSLQVGGERYEHRIRSADPDDCWRVRIEARSSDYLELAREIHCPMQPLLTTAFVDLLGKSFRAKFGSVHPAAMPAVAGR